MANRRQRRGIIASKRTAVKVVLLYAAFGILWVTLSDRLLEAVISDVSLLIEVQTYKGWFFVLLSCLFLLWILLSFVRAVGQWEEAFASKRRQLREVFDSVQTPVAMTDPEGVITFTNAAYGELLGYGPEELVGEQVAMTGLAGELPQYTPEGTLEYARQHREGWNGEALRVDRDGRIIPVYLTVSPIYEEDELKGFLGELVDLRAVDQWPPRMGGLLQTLERIAEEPDLDQAGATALAEAVAVASGDIGLIAMVDETDPSQMVVRWQLGPEEGPANFERRQGIWGDAVDKQAVRFIEDAEEMPAEVPAYPGCEVRSAVAVPLAAEEEAAGVLIVGRRDELFAVSRRVLRLLEAIGRQITVRLRERHETGESA